MTFDEWITGYTDQDKRVALTEVGDVKVSTVWLGIDYNFGGSERPLIFETMVFGGEHDELCHRYSTEAEALAGHAEVCSAVLRAGVKS